VKTSEPSVIKVNTNKAEEEEIIKYSSFRFFYSYNKGGYRCTIIYIKKYTYNKYITL